MATHHGKEGVVTVGGTEMGEVTSFTLETTGDVVEDDVYLPYGGQHSGLQDSRFLYTGKEKDTGTGFYYYGARYYHPRIGRFTSVDPVSRFVTRRPCWMGT